MKAHVELQEWPSVESREREIVERKGKGHPDSICDALAEEFSIALAGHYLKEFGRVLHYNVDKAMLFGGVSEVGFDGARVIDPIEFYIVGRATRVVSGKGVPVEDIFDECSRRWLDENMRFLEPDKHVKCKVLARAGSADLVSLYDREGGVPLANDTSFGVGYAPLSPLEALVFEVENDLNSAPCKGEMPFVGEDVKVMGVRSGREVSLTVACAMVAPLLSSLEDYVAKRESVRERVAGVARRLYDGEVSVVVNAADDDERGEVYLTVTGTSAESGDDGQVGRGNRANGLITPYRPMSLEAAAGKNPVSHVGKTYNIIASECARAIYERFDEVEGVGVYVVSRIGKPVNEPQFLDVEVRASRLTPALRDEIARVTEERVAQAPDLWRRVVRGEKVAVY